MVVFSKFMKVSAFCALRTVLGAGTQDGRELSDLSGDEPPATEDEETLEAVESSEDQETAQKSEASETY